MNLYYLAVHFEEKSCFGNLPEIGFWENYYVYEIEDHVLSRLDLLKSRPVIFPSKEVAMGWLFATAQTDSIKITDRGGTSEYLKTLSGKWIPYTKDRIKYEITNADISAGILFAKLVLHEKVDRDFANMWKYVKPQPHSDFIASYANSTRVADSDPALAHLIASYKEHDAVLKKIVDAICDSHVMVEQMSDIPDVHAALLFHFKQINELPATLKAESTNNV